MNRKMQLFVFVLVLDMQCFLYISFNKRNKKLLAYQFFLS